MSTATYDLRGRKLSSSDPHMGTWTYKYNALGELRLQQDAKGQLAQTDYDVLGRIVQRLEPDLVSTWSYDAHNAACAAAPNTARGKLTRAATSTGYERIDCYDALGRPVSQRTSMDGEVFWTGNVYEAGTGRLLRTVYPARVQPNPAPAGNTAPAGGYQLANVYSAVGLVGQSNASAAVATPLWRINSLAPNGAGLIARTTLGNNLIEQHYTDSKGRMAYYTAGPSTTSYVEYQAYRYDAWGKRRNLNGGDFVTGAGCMSSSIAGGDCKSGALSAGLNKLAAPYIQSVTTTDSYTLSVALGSTLSGIVGGTISELSGGKFSNGASTAAMLYAYNQMRFRAARAAPPTGIPGSQAARGQDYPMPRSFFRNKWKYRLYRLISCPDVNVVFCLWRLTKVSSRLSV